MTLKRKSMAGLGLGVALFNVAAGAALAHDPEVLETPHGYTNAEDCGASGPNGGAGGPSENTNSGYPDPGSAYGSFAADCNAVQGVDSETLEGTVHILASLTLDDVVNRTADVNTDDTVEEGDMSSLNPAVLAFDFPTQLPAGGVNSDSFNVEVTTNSRWELSAAVTAPFAKPGDATAVKDVATFAVAHDAAGDSDDETTNNDNVGGAFTALDAPVVVETDLESDDGASNGFHFRSNADALIDAGDYVGEITLTVTAIQ